MTIETTFHNLLGKFHAARETLESLRLTAIEDRPTGNETLLVERLGDVVEDLRGWLAEGLQAAADAERAVGNPFDGYQASRSLAVANERVIRLEYRFFCDGSSCEQVLDLRRLGRRQGREWLGWTGSVIQALEQCRRPLQELDEGFLQAWLELAERLGSRSVSLQTTNIGQISGAAGRSRAGGVHE